MPRSEGPWGNPRPAGGVEDQPGEAYKLLAQLARLGINLVAVTAIPVGPSRTQLTLLGV